MKPTTQTVIRSLLKVGGGALIAKGVTDEAGLESAIGAIVTLIGFVWGIVSAKKAKAAAIAAAAATAAANAAKARG